MSSGRIFVLALVLGAVPQTSPRLLASISTSAFRSVGIARSTAPTYSVDVGLRGEIFPAFANYASLQPSNERPFGAVTVTITNATDSELRQHVSAQVVGWSDVETQTVSVAVGEVRTLVFAPAFLPRFYANREVAPATVVVKISDEAGRPVYSEAHATRLRPSEDIYWGPELKFAPLVASWVMPHDPHVEALLSRAANLMPSRRMPGYETWKSSDQQRMSTFEQAQAIYRTVQQNGMSFRKGSPALGQNPGVPERIRMPGDSIAQRRANCLEGAVLYASLFENLGMDAEVVLVPGHAYIGVREARDSADYLYFDASLRGRSQLDAAVRAAHRGLRRWTETQILRIPISKARDSGIYPMPLPGRDVHHYPMDEATATTSLHGREKTDERPR